MIFTPTMAPGSTYPGETMPDGRAVMDLTPADDQLYAAAADGEWTTVTDLTTGTVWEVRRSDCGLGCRCAAMARTPGGADQRTAAASLLAEYADVEDTYAAAVEEAEEQGAEPDTDVYTERDDACVDLAARMADVLAALI